MEPSVKPLLQRVMSLILSIVLLVTVGSVALPVTAADHSDHAIKPGTKLDLAIQGECDYKIANEILTIVNAERKKVGKKALAMDKTLTEYAMQRAAECAVYYSHTRPNGEMCFSLLEGNYTHFSAGENIAAGCREAKTVMEGWMNSPGHRANILNNFQSIGIGVFQVDGVYYWCQLFSGMNKKEDSTQKKAVSKTLSIEVGKNLLNLSISQKKLTLKDGETATLNVYNHNIGFPYYEHPLDPNGFTFTPAKAGIVTVSASGVVKPIGNGSTTITVKSKNGVTLFTVSVTAQVKNPHTKHDYSAATCTKPKTCKVCGATSGKKLEHTYTNACDKSCNRCKATRSVAAHTYKKVITKATLTKDGSSKNICSKCGYTSGKATLYKASKISLSTTAYTYDGKVKKPSVVVKDSKGKTISSSNYTVTYASGRKNVGTYKVTVKFKGNYSGTKTLTFKINPVKTTVKATAAKKSLKLTIGKKSTQATGYEVQHSTSKSFTSYKTKTLTSYKTTSTTLSGLKAKTTYYIRVRTYKTINGVKMYSGWSTVVSKKTL